MASEIIPGTPEIIKTVQYVVPYIPIIGVIIAILMSVVTFWRIFKSKKECSKIMYIQSPDEIEIFEKKIDDLEKVTIKTTTGNKVYNLSETKPLILRTFWGRQPLYLVGAASALGMTLENDEIKPIHKPDVISKMVESKLVKDIVESSPDGKKFDMFIFIAGLAAGVAVTFILNAMGVMKI